MIRPRVVVSWSGGKDSSMALQHIAETGESEVVGLLTTITADYDRISIHGVRRSLLRQQCSALRQPLIEVNIPATCSNAEYEAAMTAPLIALRDQGIRDVVFGDLFLEDVRAYRERLLAEVGMTAHFPLWGRDTNALARSFIRDGGRAVIVCIDGHQLPTELCGQEFDADLLAALPETCDPCGERGEFHTFVYDSEIFCRPVPIQRGETVERGGFVFCDLLPVVSPAS